ncbi:MAG TPA: hypothetical protein VGK97_10460, partial [Spongiibacteraceae bacterium]
DYRDLALLTIAQLPALSHCDNPASAFTLLENSDALRRPQRFSLLLDIAETLQIAPITIQRLSTACKNASAIISQPLLERGFSGKSLGEQLQRERLAAVQKHWS